MKNRKMKFSKRNLWLIILLIPISACFFSCASGKATLYSEQSIQPNEVSIKTIAILPNRLPLNLTNSEYWKEINYNFMKSYFVRKGYKVIDYSTANRLFEKSGLPMEDTKSSRDKYAELAEEMGADVLIIPYYGQLFNSINAMIFMFNKYEAVTSLQFYSVEKNDFLSRVDIEGVTKVPILMYPPIGLPLLFIPPKAYYRKAYRKSLEVGVERFAQKYPCATTSKTSSHTTGSTSSSSIQNSNTESSQQEKTIESSNSSAQNQNTNSTPANNSTEEKLSYEELSKEELEKLKQEAVEMKDFRKAAEIKEELEYRSGKSRYSVMSIQELEELKKKAVDAKDYGKAAEIKKELDSRK